MQILGIDFGGSGIKGAIVDTETDELITDRYRIETPESAKPKDVAEVIAEIAKFYKYSGKIGVGFPAAVQNGVVRTAANIDKSWIGTNAAALFTKATNCNTVVLNDADAAGEAEIRFGVGWGIEGLILLITVGTGIGTAVFVDGKLLPNTELGHIYLPNGHEAEKYASDASRKKHELSWEDWGKRIDLYLNTMEKLFFPDLFILGGGVSKKFDKYADILTIKTKIVPAKSLNFAGMIGAAIYAAKRN